MMGRGICNISFLDSAGRRRNLGSLQRCIDNIAQMSCLCDCLPAFSSELGRSTQLPGLLEFDTKGIGCCGFLEPCAVVCGRSPGIREDARECVEGAEDLTRGGALDAAESGEALRGGGKRRGEGLVGHEGDFRCRKVR